MTPGYNSEPALVIQLLNTSLATEIVCVLRYRRHYFMASGIGSENVKRHFLRHANAEQTHAAQLARRIVQLGGEPNWFPAGLLSLSHSEYGGEPPFLDMIREDLIAEGLVIESYREIILYIGNDDSRTRRLLEKTLADEEKHLVELGCLLER